MEPEFTAALVAGTIVLGGWSVVAVVLGYLAHRRMTRVERELGSPAVPPFEQPLAWMAGAFVAWPFAAVLAVIALAKREWARLGRNLTFIFLGHMTAAVLAAMAAVLVNSPRAGAQTTLEELGPVVVAACVILAAGVLVAVVLAWVWLGRRSARIHLQAPRAGNGPGPWRFALYAASLLMWPVGIVCAVVYTQPHDVHVGANALRCSLVQIAIIALAVCIGLPIAMFALTP